MVRNLSEEIISNLRKIGPKYPVVFMNEGTSKKIMENINKKGIAIYERQKSEI